MNKKILVLQFRTDKTLEHERECIIKSANLKSEDFVFVNAFQKEKLNIPKSLSSFSALIIGGSGQFNLTDLSKERKQKIKKVTPLILGAIESDFPTLAICFGHQIIAEVLGGKVERDKSQAEGGTVEVHLNESGSDSTLFKNMPKQFYVSSAHKDSVTQLPKDVTVLANTNKTKYAALQIGKNIFTTQFHPELDLEDVIFRLTLYPEYLIGKSLETIRSEYQETPYSYQIIRNFISNVAK